MICPLCSHKKITILETIRKNDLIKLYKKISGKNYSYLISNDIDFCICHNCDLRFYYPLVTGDEYFYNSFQKFSWYYLDVKDEYSYAKQFILKKDRVLEIGSGKGAFAKYIPSNSYIGLDFSEKAKAMAKDNNITIENSTIQDYSTCHQGSYDVVVSFQVLEHVSDPNEFIESMLFTLKKDGKLIIAVPSENSFVQYVTNNTLNMPPHHVTRWSDDCLRNLENIFDIKLINITHEKISKIHRSYFVTTLIQNLILKPHLVDLSIKRKLLSKISSILGKLIASRLKEEMLPNGHTVMAVYRKL
jgi:2-polyprenyl-3-methyl-5-hydroxy-6-metoxy-1,4-benzoquinol methylase